MAKSTRSKVKRAYRAKKRESGVYAAAEAARLQKLNAKLAHIISSDIGKDLVVVEEPGKAVPAGNSCGKEVQTDLMPIDTPRISTHGPRNSRREEWRKSKGMPARRVHKGTTWVAMSKRRRR
ncbi:hypothetical protein AX14_004644 [Amanita brunnescens Koide BX004]|nr:hypothetical protein AX14_004644 [Amanita brunnescens Koide BX004]